MSLYTPSTAPVVLPEGSELDVLPQHKLHHLAQSIYAQWQQQGQLPARFATVLPDPQPVTWETTAFTSPVLSTVRTHVLTADEVNALFSVFYAKGVDELLAQHERAVLREHIDLLTDTTTRRLDPLVVQVLTQARQLLLEHRWVKGSYQLTEQVDGETTQHLCTWGAVRRARTDLAEANSIPWGQVGTDIRRVLNHVIAARYGPECPWPGVEEFNDAPERVFSEIIDVFDDAIILAKELTLEPSGTLVA